MRRLIQFLMCSLLLVSAVASADDLSRKQRKLLEETQIAYGATIRWGSMDDAIGYLDPKLRKEKPPTEFELNRYAQLRLAGRWPGRAPGRNRGDQPEHPGRTHRGGGRALALGCRGQALVADGRPAGPVEGAVTGRVRLVRQSAPA